MGSFQQTYKSAYTHGLEDIYSIETVDLKTVRPLRQDEQEITNSPKEIINNQPTDFDFGPLHRDWITPFLTREPIQVLHLSSRAEEAVLAIECETLDDLRNDLHAKGLGQGHIDEVQQSLSEYIGGRSLERAYTLELSSWFKSLGLDRKHFATLLQEHNLDHLLGLTAAEAVEIRHLTPKNRLEWIERGRLDLYQREELIRHDIKSIINSFVIPWGLGRGGLVAQWEVSHRLERVVDDPLLLRDVMDYLATELFEGQYPFEDGLVLLGDGLYGCHEVLQSRYHDVIDCALSYFYRPTVAYPLSDLSLWIARELGKHWKSVDRDFVQQSIRLSPQFAVRKGDCGQLLVKKS